MVEYELKKELIRKDNEDKMARQKLKDDELRHELAKRRYEQEEMRRMKMMEKEMAIKSDLEAQQKKIAEKEKQVDF